MPLSAASEFDPLRGWRYAIAVASVLATLVVQLLLIPLTGQQAPFVLYLTDIFIVGLYCGFGPALLATVLSMALVWLVYFWPQWQALPLSRPLATAILCFVCAVLGSLFGALARRERRSLNEHKDWYATSLNGIADGVIVCRTDGTIIYMNGRARVITGWNLDEIRGRAIGSIIPLRQQPHDSSETDCVLSDRFGRKHDVMVSVQSTLAADGTRKGEVWVLRDITGEHRTHAALLESERRFRLIFDAGLVGIFFAAPDGKVTAANDTFLHMLGLSRDRFDAESLDWARQTHEEFAELDRRKLAEVMEKGACESYDKRFLRVDTGEPVWAMVVACKVARDEVLVFALDIAQRKRIEQELQRSESEHRALTENVLHMVWMADAQGHRYYFNRRWYEYTGLTSAEDWKEAVHPDDAARGEAAVEQALRTGSKMVIEKRYRRSDGAYRWHLVQMTPIRNGNGEAIRWYGTCTDVEDQKRAMLALKETARRTDEFIATLSHELRNPLTTISMCAHLLARPEAGVSEREASTSALIHQSAVLARLIDDLLDLARITSGKLELQCEAIELGALVDRIINNLSRRFADSGVLLQRMDAHGAWVFIDATRVQQIIDNLLLNALRISPRGSAVQLELRLSAQQVQLLVIDHGQGISPEQIETIFEPFMQGDDSHHGLGLGLTIARRLAALQDGSIRVHSEGRGHGATFTLELPTIAAPTSICTPEAAPATDDASVRILIVEDEIEMATALSTYLSMEGHECRCATSEESAIREALSFTPEVVICDIALGDQWGGYEVARRLRADAATRDALLIAFTGYGRDEDAQRIHAAGFDEHLVKPASPQAICALIARWHEQASSSTS